MTAETFTPFEEAFVALWDHCPLCPDCRVEPERPAKPACPVAETLYRTWFTLWRGEIPR